MSLQRNIGIYPPSCIHGRWVARCVDPGCNCLDRAGIIIDSPEQSPRGYEVELAGTPLCPDCQACYDENPSAYIE